MNIIVLAKQTLDTEERILIKDGKVAEDGAKFILNPYDEYAVEEAIRQKEKNGGRITVLSVGPERSAEALRTALAMGADEAALISDEGLTDEYGVSLALAAYVRQHGCDLLLGGSFSVDNGAGQVAVRVAGLLGIPHTSSITRLEIDGGRAVVLRDAEGDSETVEVVLPALFTAQQGLNDPRYPSLPGIMKAKKKPFRCLQLADLGLSEADVAPRTERTSLSLPPDRPAGRRLSGEPKQQAAQLVRLLQTEGKLW
ncbi:electron transfer flavoprotein subunit beta/FixA family protein [Paenibacillus puerhi]|uniref:electron transfer flavoprotein subunit beta/FixA family protein n=1 Tax=Paenibacillus puerhi TaxID=2692622 RepID=UPI00135B15E9|nr:electron transfer flavoprotein subunit beta/FixA family protein [Paenibacillus puerhi]